ncbi:MAG: DUF4276 family protein, partial [Bacteroidales bacterium]|nr:DUF4276 family protein [Bacteroidales bacterium]
MKGEIAEILVEEPSMKHFLQGILPGILPKGYILNSNCFIRAHQGKQDLRKSIPKKAGAYQKYSVPIRLIVIHDQDSADCILLKKELRDLIISNSTITHLIRIACRELEAWYLGDLDALQAVYPRFKAEKYKNRKLFRNPDECQASHEIK